MRPSDLRPFRFQHRSRAAHADLGLSLPWREQAANQSHARQRAAHCRPGGVTPRSALPTGTSGTLFIVQIGQTLRRRSERMMEESEWAASCVRESDTTASTWAGVQLNLIHSRLHHECTPQQAQFEVPNPYKERTTASGSWIKIEHGGVVRAVLESNVGDEVIDAHRWDVFRKGCSSVHVLEGSQATCRSLSVVLTMCWAESSHIWSISSGVRALLGMRRTYICWSVKASPDSARMSAMAEPMPPP